MKPANKQVNVIARPNGPRQSRYVGSFVDEIAAGAARPRNDRTLLTLLLALGLCFTPMAFAADGYWGFGIRVETGWFIPNPKIKSATVRQLAPDSEAANKGVQNDDKITRVGDCEIPSCRGKLAKKMIEVEPGVTRSFDFQRPDGSSYSVELTAIPWPYDD